MRLPFFLSVRKDWVHTAIVEPWFQSKLLAWLGCRVPFGFSVSVCFQATCGHLLQRSLAVSCGHASGCKWLQVTDLAKCFTCGHLQSLAITCGHLRSLAVTCGHLRSLAASCGHLRSLVVTCGLLQPLEWLQVAASGRKWPQVAASDRFFDNQLPRVLRAQWELLCFKHTMIVSCGSAI